MKTSLAVLLGALLVLSGQPAFASVGFMMLQVANGSEPPLEVGVWYPTDAAPRPTRITLLTQEVAPEAPLSGLGLPLVVISHGNGGNFANHAATALALAQDGFVVAAPTHTGDNNRDQSRATDLAGRTRAIAAVIDHMASNWLPGAIDPGRIGAFGHSAGAFTVLVAAGGEPDLSRMGPHCVANPRLFDCRLLATSRRGAVPTATEAQGVTAPFTRDRRLRALVLAAPALGFTFPAAGLTEVTVPVQLWAAADDVILPLRLYAEPVQEALPRPPEFHLVAHAGHFDFMAPCSEALARVAPAICVSAPGFDRTEFSGRFNTEVVAFLKRTLLP